MPFSRLFNLRAISPALAKRLPRRRLPGKEQMRRSSSREQFRCPITDNLMGKCLMKGGNEAQKRARSNYTVERIGERLNLVLKLSLKNGRFQMPIRSYCDQFDSSLLLTLRGIDEANRPLIEFSSHHRDRDPLTEIEAPRMLPRRSAEYQLGGCEERESRARDEKERRRQPRRVISWK